jgi:hypothetical protein
MLGRYILVENHIVCYEYHRHPLLLLFSFVWFVCFVFFVDQTVFVCVNTPKVLICWLAWSADCRTAASGDDAVVP